MFQSKVERTTWCIADHGRNLVQVALDIGFFDVAGRKDNICELTVALTEGTPNVLFDIANHFAQIVAVLPLNFSRAERGRALARNALNQPYQALPPLITPDLPYWECVRRVLSEMFEQFLSNLHAMRIAFDPEVVHQARVGWRRFSSAIKLFKPILPAGPLPDWRALHPLLEALAELRNIDMVRTELLPQIASQESNGRHLKKWKMLFDGLERATELRRSAVTHALESRAVGVGLLATYQWLENLSKVNTAANVKPELSLPCWARHRVARLHARLKADRRQAGNPQQEHLVRILSKRLRYCIEALRPVLPKRKSRRWYQMAIKLQRRIGAEHDIAMMIKLFNDLEMDHALIKLVRHRQKLNCASLLKLK